MSAYCVFHLRKNILTIFLHTSDREVVAQSLLCFKFRSDLHINHRTTRIGKQTTSGITGNTDMLYWTILQKWYPRFLHLILKTMLSFSLCINVYVNWHSILHFIIIFTLLLSLISLYIYSALLSLLMSSFLSYSHRFPAILRHLDNDYTNVIIDTHAYRVL